MRAEVRPRRAALPPQPRPHPPSTTGAAAQSRGARRAAAGAQAQSLLRSRAGAPSARREESRSRGAGTPERAPSASGRASKRAREVCDSGLVTQPSPRGPHLRGSDVAPAPAPPAPVPRAASLFSPGGAARPAPARILPGQRPDQLQGAGRPVPRRGRASAELCGGALGACEPPGTRDPRGSAPGACSCTCTALQVPALPRRKPSGGH